MAKGWERTADFLGLVAYLTIMFGKLPDRRMLSEAYDAAGQMGAEAGRALLSVVPAATPAPESADESIEFAA
jgi:hypothetical protein